MPSLRFYAYPAQYSGERDFIGTFAQTCGTKLGHQRVSDPAEADYRIRWGVHGDDGIRPTIFCELGWLPRWSFQVSHSGINARHHLAGAPLERLTGHQLVAVREHLARVRAGDGWPDWQYCNPLRPPVEHLPTPFYLVPLQVETDTNMENAPAELRTTRGLIDYVSGLGLDARIVFLCHPNTKAKKPHDFDWSMRRRGPYKDVLMPATFGIFNVHSYLKAPTCRGVVTVNSNVAHDALLWGRAVTTLGSGFWPRDAFASDNREPYVHHLMEAQWTIHDVRDRSRVEEAVHLALAAPRSRSRRRTSG